MALSSLLIKETPQYELVVPSTNKKFKYRPFLVKEEKILLVAQETNDIQQIYTSISEVIQSCVPDIEGVEDMPLFDVEYIFLQLRAKSVGEIVQPTITCQETGENIPIEINLTSIGVEFPKDHTKNIKLNDDVLVHMKYPTIRNVIERHDGEVTDLYDNVVDCIGTIESNKESFKSEDYPREEIEDFVNHLNNEQFSKLLDFLITSPRLEQEVKYTASDDIERRVVFSGISDFFL